MRKLIFAFLFLTFSIINLYSQSGWFVVYQGFEFYQLRDIYFFNENTGYISDISGLFKTTNSGINWLRISSYNLNFLKFINLSAGYFTSDYYKFLMTTDGGTTMLISNQGLSNGRFWGLSFPTISIGYIVSSNSEIYKTTNQSSTWICIKQSDSGRSSLGSISFINNYVGLTGGANRNNTWDILRTSNGGGSWDSVEIADNILQINDIEFISTTTAYILGELEDSIHQRYYGVIYKTINSGFNWVRQYTDSLHNLYTDIYFLNETTGYAVCYSGVFIKTTNGGNNWNVYNILGGVVRIFLLTLILATLLPKI